MMEDPIADAQGVFVYLSKFFQGQLQVNGIGKDGEPGTKGIGGERQDQLVKQSLGGKELVDFRPAHHDDFLKALVGQLG
jgi:hypothetical protein